MTASQIKLNREGILAHVTISQEFVVTVTCERGHVRVRLCNY